MTSCRHEAEHPSPVTESTLLDTADAEMRFARIRHLPVVDATDRVVGIISTQDVVRAMALNRSKLQLPAASVMRADVFTVRGDEPLAKAVAQLIEYKIGALPVVDAKGQLMGILTDTDVVRWAYEQMTGVAYAPPPIE